jgi:uncharacterized protein (TIGR02246 family)
MTGMSRKDIDIVDLRLSAAVRNGDAAAAAALYTEDGTLLPPNSDFITGRENIQTFFQAVIDGGLKGLNISTLELDIQDDSAHEMGTYEMVADGGVVIDNGKFIVIWKRLDGKWLLHRDMINTSRSAEAN